MGSLEDETVLVTFVVTNARPINTKILFALVDVDMQIEGVVFSIFGIQARRELGGNTSIRLPTFKDADGSWRSAMQLPDELRCPLADAVLAFLIDRGLAKRRFETNSGTYSLLPALIPKEAST